MYGTSSRAVEDLDALRNALELEQAQAGARHQPQGVGVGGAALPGLGAAQHLRASTHERENAWLNGLLFGLCHCSRRSGGVGEANLVAS